jgi:peptide/nickel transport system substrate-binding protein
MVRRTLTVVGLAVLAALGLSSAAGAQSPSALRIGTAVADGSLTPYTFSSDYAFMSLVYDTLTWRDSRGVAQPWLASSISRDVTGQRVTVRLRSGIHWQDGQDLTANDVVFTYQYMASHPHPRFTAELQDIESATAVRPLVVVFRLRNRALGLEDQPFADVPIIPRHLWAGLAPGRIAPPGLPIGSGPYRLTAYKRGHSYRFDANRGYFRGAPSVARIDVPIIRRQESLLAFMRRSKADAVPVAIPPGTTPSRLPGTQFDDELSYNGTMLMFNVRRQPFARRAARRAVAQALNLKAIAGNTFGNPGGTVPADHGMLHPRSRWARAGMLTHFDPSAAQLAFAEQGVGAFRVAAPRNDPTRLEAAKRVVVALRSAGADARLLTLSPRALDRALGRRTTRPTFDAAVLGIPALASYDPSYLRALFGDPHTASLNDGGYRSTRFAVLAARAADARTERERRAATNKELRFLAQDLPAVPLFFGGGAFAYRPGAYNSWVSVRGTGILDKRSFLQGPAKPQTSSPATAAATDITDPDTDKGISLVPFIIGFGALVLLGSAWWWRRMRR